MSLNHLKKYDFGNDYGITGNLADDPIFAETKEGEEFASFAIYCVARKTEDDDKKSHRRYKKTADDEIKFIAYVRVFDEDLLVKIEQLKKGYFVNFTYDKLTFCIGEDTETGEFRANADFVANDIAVRHIPGTKKERRSQRKSQTNDDQPRRQKTRSRRRR